MGFWNTLNIGGEDYAFFVMADDNVMSSNPLICVSKDDKIVLQSISDLYFCLRVRKGCASPVIRLLAVKKKHINIMKLMFANKYQLSDLPVVVVTKFTFSNPKDGSSKSCYNTDTFSCNMCVSPFKKCEGDVLVTHPHISLNYSYVFDKLTC